MAGAAAGSVRQSEGTPSTGIPGLAELKYAPSASEATKESMVVFFEGILGGGGDERLLKLSAFLRLGTLFGVICF